MQDERLNAFALTEYYWEAKFKTRGHIGPGNHVRTEEKKEMWIWGVIQERDILLYPSGVHLVLQDHISFCLWKKNSNGGPGTSPSSLHPSRNSHNPNDRGVSYFAATTYPRPLSACTGLYDAQNKHLFPASQHISATSAGYLGVASCFGAGWEWKRSWLKQSCNSSCEYTANIRPATILFIYLFIFTCAKPA